MADKRPSEFMRERARRLRLIAQTATTQNSPKILEIAGEMEKLADTLDAVQESSRPR